MRRIFVRVGLSLEESLARWKKTGNKRDIMYALLLQASMTLYRGNPVQAGAQLEESLTLCREMSDTRGIAYVLVMQGFVAFFQEEHAVSRSSFEESLTFSRRAGDRGGMALGLYGLGWLALGQGDDMRARTRYEESLAILRKSDYSGITILCLDGLAGTAVTQRKFAWAVRLWAAAETLREVISGPLPPVARITSEPAVASARVHMSEQAFAWAEGRTMTLEYVLAAQGQETTSTPTLKGQLPYPDRLTTREVEVLRWVAQGLTDAQIAKRLIVSLHTVHTHVRSIHRKTHITSRSGLAGYAFTHELL
ncbi:MAG: LuxR C-terminal-related transcriptional regulator [Ktedonobacteraceae bacterium]